MKGLSLSFCDDWITPGQAREGALVSAASRAGPGCRSTGNEYLLGLVAEVVVGRLGHQLRLAHGACSRRRSSTLGVQPLDGRGIGQEPTTARTLLVSD